MFEDLEAQAEALQHLERAAEVADRTRAEYGGVSLDARLMASRGRDLEVDVLAAGRLQGRLERVGPGWFQLDGAFGVAWVRTEAVTGVLGASPRALPELAWSPVDTLGLGSVLRRLAEEQEGVVLQLLDGTRHEGRVGRVGRDFVELVAPAGTGPEATRLVPTAHVAVVRAPG